MLEAKSNGTEDCLFLNGNGKDSISRIAKPLRSMGIPTAAIVDLDIIQNSFKKVVDHAFIPTSLVDSFETLKNKVMEAFNNYFVQKRIVKGKVQDFGINVLPKGDKESAEHLLNALSEYGIFLVPVGEIEHWLTGISKPSHGPYWLTQAFEKMGIDPSDPNYMLPSDEGVWNFVRKISKWIADPNRKGMPS